MTTHPSGRRALLALAPLGALVLAAATGSVASPPPVASLPAATHPPAAMVPAVLDTAVLAGGCFWGMELVYEHVKGVTSVVSGYAGGHGDDPDYQSVSSGTTGYAESVRIVYDPARISYADLLRVFFSAAHDPTQLNRQGPDVGSQYRSAIFFANQAQERDAREYVRQLAASKYFSRPIVTEIAPLHGFHEAEAYHQDYAMHHPDQPYIVINDKPRLEQLRSRLPQLYTASRAP